MKNEYYGVHQAHCCIKHGCKYGEKDCPVVLGLTIQQYPCEDCGEAEHKNGINYVKKIIENAINKHNINLPLNDPNIESLVSYVLLIGYNDGYKDRGKLIV